MKTLNQCIYVSSVDALRNLLLFGLLKKRSWRSVTFSNTPPWTFFSHFLNSTNGTKSRKASQMRT